MFSCWSVVCLGAVVVVFFLYKLIDRVLRIPRIGGYSGRFVLVTGCDTGFGNLLAKRLDQLGCHVFAGCLTEKGETELRKASSSERLTAFSLDVTSRDSVQKALKLVKSKLPEGKGIWGIVNNAGVISSMGRPEWVRLDDYKGQCDVNLWGLIDVTLTFLPLVKRERGRVVSTSSIAGVTAFTDFAAYCISKFGVEVFGECLRRSLRPFGCKSLLIVPGVHNGTNLMPSEHLLRLNRKAFDSADPEVKEEYGQEYANFVSDPMSVSGLLANGSDRVTDVVDAYEHALFGRFPRARYMVGWDAVCVYNPLRYVPEWLSDWFFEKIEPNRPLPAAVRKK